VAIADGNGEEGEVRVKVKEFPVRRVRKEEICDTNGAGWVSSHLPSYALRYQIIAVEARKNANVLWCANSDAFAGGFVAGIVEGKSLEQAIDMGQWLASLSIRELGPS